MRAPVLVDVLRQWNRAHRPFAPARATWSPVFVCFLWDEILRTQYLNGNAPSACLKSVQNTFLREMSQFHGPEFDSDAFTSCARRIHDKGLKNFSREAWYHVPSILRVLAPTEEALLKASPQIRRSYMVSVMRGLPHGIIMGLCRNFRVVCFVEECHNEKDVRVIN